jgi:hypothetical protein
MIRGTTSLGRPAYLPSPAPFNEREHYREPHSLRPAPRHLRYFLSRPAALVKSAAHAAQAQHRRNQLLQPGSHFLSDSFAEQRRRKGHWFEEGKGWFRAKEWA